MCEFFGFSADKEMDVRAELSVFFSHGRDNPNGWGFAATQHAPVGILTEPVNAAASETAAHLAQTLPPLRSCLAHIRKATIGEICKENCHPFSGVDRFGRQWVLMHNGTIFNGNELLPFRKVQTGSTDSERILLYLLDRINALASAPDAKERISLVENSIQILSWRNKLNLMIYDGEQLYVHVNMHDTLFYTAEDSAVLFATTPLNDRMWQPVELCTLLVYADGKRLYTGKTHDNIFVDVLQFVTDEADFTI